MICFLIYRYENPQQFRAGGDHETPRSPSPEESERFSQHCIPKAIPNQRSDSDLRHNSTASRKETVSRDSYRPSSIADHHSRPLRTEPIEIPLHTGSVEGFSNKDQDYRPPYEQSMVNGRLSLDERRVTYNRSSPDLQHGGTSFPKRESRFDRYGGDRSSMNVGRPYEEPLHSNNQPKMNQWDSQPGWDSHSRDRPHSGERDRPFQSRGQSNTGPSSARTANRWDSSSSQHPRQHFPSSRSQDNLREPISGPHAPTHSYRNGEQPHTRMDRQSVRHEPNHKGWSSRDQSSSNSHNFDRDLRDTDLPSGKNYRQNEIPPRHGLPPQSSSGFPVPNLPAPASTTQPAPRVPNYPPNAVSPHQSIPWTTSSSTTSSSQSSFRREDPRLASRSKPAPVIPSPTNLPPLPSPPPTVPVVPTPPVVAPQRFSTSAMPGLSRFGDQRDIPKRTPPVKPPTPADPPKGNPKGPTKDMDVRKEAQKPTSTPSGTDSTSGSNSRSPEGFVSPLNSLYSGASNSGQTGRGYGVQSYKIPKKKTLVDHSKGVTKPKPPLETDTSTVISTESSSPIESATRTNDGGLKTTSGDKELNQNSDDLPIPLETLENYLKKKLPSDDAKKVLDRLKSGTDFIEPSSSPSSSKKTGAESRISDSDSAEISLPAPRSSPGVDTTVSSTGDNFTLAMSEDEGVPDVSDKTETVSKAVTSSDHQNPTEAGGKGKKGKGRKSVPLEVARLREDLTDFMKGTSELGTRRCRSKSAQPVADGTSEDEKTAPAVRSEKPAVPEKAKRGRKRKVTVNERNFTAYSPVNPTEEGTDAMDEASTSMEPSNATESPMEFPNPLRGKTSTRGRKRKGAVRGGKSAANERSPDEPCNKARKKKTPLVPTHFSLRGRRSMYEDFEPTEQIEEHDTPASGEQYFQCQKCSYLGQKIVHHYVNEHPDSENPHISVPASEWETISAQTSPTVPPHYKVNVDLLKDLSWIPARPNYTNPVQCKLCAYSTCKRSELLEHVMIHALPPNCKYRCSLCSLTEANFFDMMDHIAGHTGEFRYRCNYCDFRVAHRAGIKHHMSSMHESQDELFYTTKPLPEADRLWIFGFVCKCCRYFQMAEEGLERHRDLHPECVGHVKVNLITVSHDSAAPESETTEDDPTTSNAKEKGIFLCPGLDSARREHLDEDQWTESLKLNSTSFIETLAEKLTKPDAEQISPVASPTLEKECQPVVPILVNTNVAVDEKTESSNKEEIQPTVQEKIAVTEPSMEAENSQQAGSSRLPLTEVLSKPNALLETVISKLVGKLGGAEVDAANSAEFVDDEEEDIEDVEEEEEEEDDSFEDEDSEV